MSEVTWGLDLSTYKNRTAAVAIDWSSPGKAKVRKIIHPLAADDIASLIAGHREDQWAVDVPFGWPEPFVDFLEHHRSGPLHGEKAPDVDARRSWRTHELALRRTDLFVMEELKKRSVSVRPLSVSFQLLGATAALWALVEAQLAQESEPLKVDRSGMSGNVCEAYPAAALTQWGHGRVKRTWLELKDLFTFLTADDDLLDRFDQFSSSDVCDAIVCALVARARTQNATFTPPEERDRVLATREGWIHMPSGDAFDLPTTP